MKPPHPCQPDEAEQANIDAICRFAQAAPIEQALVLMVAMVNCYPKSANTAAFVGVMCGPIGTAIAGASETGKLVDEAAAGWPKWRQQRKKETL